MNCKFIILAAFSVLSIVSCKARQFNESSVKSDAPGSLLFHCKTQSGDSFKIFRGIGNELNIGGSLRKIISASVDSSGDDTTVFRFQPDDNGAGDGFTIFVGADLNPDRVLHGETDLKCVGNALVADTLGMRSFANSISSSTATTCGSSINLFSCTTKQGNNFSICHVGGPELKINGTGRTASKVVVKSSDDSTFVVFSFNPTGSGDGLSVSIGADNNPDSILQGESRTFCSGKAQSDLQAIRSLAKHLD